MASDSLDHLAAEIVACRRCPRLVAWREEVAANPRPAYRGQRYWGRPVPGFGDPAARLLVAGLAPAAHGANRTGRMFTGDRSGEWLYRALHKAGFANQASSVSRNDGLRLKDALITATVRCAPPGNKPLPREIERCLPYLRTEIEQMREARVFLVLGKLAFDQTWGILKERNEASGPRPLFKHGAAVKLESGRWLLASFHPSQQNTFTGKLTGPMFDAVFRKAREILS